MSARCLKHVVGEDIPPGEGDVLQTSQGYKVLDQGAVAIGSLAQADGCHLGQRPYRLGDCLADCFHAGDQGSGDCPHADQHDS